MTGYAIAKLIHVAFATLGIGAVAGLAIAARQVKRHPEALATSPLAALARWSSISLGVMLITGIWIDFEMHGAFHEALWFRASGLALVLTGAALGILRRTLGRALGGRLEPARALARIATLAMIACALVLVLVVLMERRPT
jgi:hypothetical protein